jgi:hypothetical protein
MVRLTEWDIQGEEYLIKNYHDRGKVKWQGMYLSEHTSAIAKDRAKRSEKYEKKERMNEIEIGASLFYAYANHCLVSIQLDEYDTEGRILPDIQGIVSGTIDEGILINGQKIELEKIRHIELLNMKKWCEI